MQEYRATDGDMDTAVIITVTDWNEAPRIRHQIARQLARFYQVLFVETPTSWSSNSSTQAVENVAPNIWRYRLQPAIKPLRRLKNYVSIANRFINIAHINELRQVLAQFPGEYILFNFNCDFPEIMKLDFFCLKVYFCNDDFASLTTNLLSRQITLQRESKVAAAADFCLAVSYPLVDTLKAINPNTSLLLPGHEVNTDRIPVLDRVKQNIIKVVFMGYISKRLEFEWLEYAAAQPDIEIHLVGPVLMCRRSNDPIEISPKTYEKLSEVFSFHGPMYGNELSDFLTTMDVCSIPYRLDIEAIRACTAPNKFFTYVALRKPVVISNMPHHVELSKGVIYRADSPDSFVREIRLAFQEDSDQLRAMRSEIAQEYTWNNQGDKLKRLIDAKVANQGQVS